MIGRFFCRLGFHPWPEIVRDDCGGEWWRCWRCHHLTPVECRARDGSSITVGGVIVKAWPTIDIAYCPTHGLHGERDRCFVCDEPVTRVRMRPVEPLPGKGEADR